MQLWLWNSCCTKHLKELAFHHFVRKHLLMVILQDRFIAWVFLLFFHIGILLLELNMFPSLCWFLEFLYFHYCFNLIPGTILLFYFYSPLCHVYYIHFFVNIRLFLKMEVSNILGTRDWFHGRLFFHRWGRGMSSGFKCMTFAVHFISIIIISAQPQLIRHFVVV